LSSFFSSSTGSSSFLFSFSWSFLLHLSLISYSLPNPSLLKHTLCLIKPLIKGTVQRDFKSVFDVPIYE
jgi:hypothetical protein